jgi:hypothetical protein
MEYFWSGLPMTAPYILPADLPQIINFNENPKLSEKRRLQLHVLPEPYIGHVDAPIVFLKLNPGYTPNDIRFTEDEYAREVWTKSIFHQPIDYPFYPLDPMLHWTECARWWRKKIRWVLEYADSKTVANLILCIEAFPYHSYNNPRFPGKLPSQDYSFQLVDRAIKRNALIFLGNSVEFWRASVPRLSEHPNVYIANSAQNSSISPGNYPEGFLHLQQVLRSHM